MKTTERLSGTGEAHAAVRAGPEKQGTAPWTGVDPGS